MVFGGDVWSEGGFTLLHSGRQLPCANEQAERNEGVGIILDEAATAALKEAGEIWEAVSSRIVTARIKLGSAGCRLHGSSREKTNTFMTIACSYAPTAKAPHTLKRAIFMICRMCWTGYQRRIFSSCLVTSMHGLANETLQRICGKGHSGHMAWTNATKKSFWNLVPQTILQ